MGDLKTVLRFGWQYMRPYGSRLLAGILLGCLCGLTAGTFIWATRTLAERLTPADKVEAHRAEKKQKKYLITLPQSWQANASELKARLDAKLENWLPRVGAEFTWQRILGALMLLP